MTTSTLPGSQGQPLPPLNELTRALIHEAWPTGHKSIGQLREAVDGHWRRVIRRTIGMTVANRAARLLAVLRPECFGDPDDICDNCSIEAANRLEWFLQAFVLPRHPELQLDHFTEADVQALGYQFGRRATFQRPAPILSGIQATRLHLGEVASFRERA